MNLSLIDKCILNFDRLLRQSRSQHIFPARPSPAQLIPEHALSPSEKQSSVAMMRVNHSGEICAQALYRGQAFMAKSTQQYTELLQAANEEQDHLNWCKQRLTELDGKTSIFNPAWFLGSLAIGAIAGLAGDKISLGFLAETERQVTQHLDKHLNLIPQRDLKSRTIIQQMRYDEMQHADLAVKAGATSLPLPVKILMRCTAKVMTATAAKV